MAMKPLRPCRHPGCCELTREGWCPKHKPKDRRSADAAAWHKLYNLDVWKYDLRPEQLMREPFCRECAKRGVRVRATEVDHIVPHRGDMALFADRQNLQSLCKSCHSRKTLAENKQIFAPRKRR